MSRCFLFGHRDTPESIRPCLSTAIRHHITTLGVTEFIVGYHGAFDRLAIGVLQDLKREFPHIRALLLLSYHPTFRPVPVPPLFDGTVLPPHTETVPPRFSVLKANQYMLQHADYAIVYVWQTASNTAMLLHRARTYSHLRITNLADMQPPSID